jgi:RNA-binding protein
MSLTKSEIKALKARAHHLKVVLQIGAKGISEGLLSELDTALNAHELIKIHIAGTDKTARQSMTQELCDASGADLVQMIGLISVLYRPRPQEVAS